MCPALIELSIIIELVGCLPGSLASTVLHILLVQLVTPLLAHGIICYAQVLEHCICRCILCTTGHLEYSGGRCELHVESTACTLLHIKLGRHLVLGVVFSVNPWFKPHQVVEGVLMAIANECTTLGHIGYTQQGHPPALLYNLIGQCIL